MSTSSEPQETVALAHGAAGDGDPTCVLLHGITLDGDDLRPLALTLSERHTVVSVDLRGHGRSPAGSRLEIADLAADVCALVDSLELRNTVVIGHSLGGLVALAAAASAPGRFAGLVILDSTPAPTADALVWLKGLSASIAGPEYTTMWPEFCRTALFGYTAEAELRDRISAQMGAAPPELTRPLVRSFNDFAEHEGLDALGACEMPILMISSSSPTNDEDAITAVAPQTVFAQVVASGHFLHHEVLDQLYPMVEHFISDCLPLPQFSRPTPTNPTA